MILVKNNLHFIQKSQLEHSCTQRAKYHLLSRITLAGNAILLAAEALVRITGQIFLALGRILTGSWELKI